MRTEKAPIYKLSRSKAPKTPETRENSTTQTSTLAPAINQANLDSFAKVFVPIKSTIIKFLDLI